MCDEPRGFLSAKSCVCLVIASLVAESTTGVLRSAIDRIWPVATSSVQQSVPQAVPAAFPAAGSVSTELSLAQQMLREAIVERDAAAAELESARTTKREAEGLLAGMEAEMQELAVDLAAAEEDLYHAEADVRRLQDEFSAAEASAADFQAALPAKKTAAITAVHARWATWLVDRRQELELEKAARNEQRKRIGAPAATQSEAELMVSRMKAARHEAAIRSGDEERTAVERLLSEVRAAEQLRDDRMNRVRAAISARDRVNAQIRMMQRRLVRAESTVRTTELTIAKSHERIPELSSALSHCEAEVHNCRRMIQVLANPAESDGETFSI